MSMIVPCGSWRSPITSNLIVAGAIGLNQPCLDGGDAYWIESRPQEKGRRVLVKHGADGQTCDVTPSGFSVRTRAHEYGGGDYTVAEGTIYFANDSDQRLYRQTRGSAPVAITGGEKFRYAEPLLDRPRQRLYAVREDHTSASVINSIVSIDPRGDPAGGMLLLSGADFYSSPRLSPSGYRLAWLQWNLPDMPWDGCELWVGELNETGAEVINRVKVAGSRNESIYQPEWSPKGVLHFVSDRTGWWNLYRWKTGKVEPLFECPAEFGVPQWVFGTSTYAVESEHLLLCSYKERGLWRMARLDTERRSIQIIETPFDHISYVTADAQHAVFIAGSAKAPESVVKLGRTGELEVLRCSSNVTVDPKYVSLPVPIEFPTENGLTAHAFYYPPKNDDFAAPPGEKPPLLVKSHGGPTSATSSTFNLSIQFWTSRGFAVVDVNYGGSTGYGRAYRERLNGQWGIVDVDDCVNAARHLVRQGLADETRLAIRGGPDVSRCFSGRRELLRRQRSGSVGQRHAQV
jgi:dipeptidyl aminopeptidase/acylaminoacyl peptidase